MDKKLGASAPVLRVSGTPSDEELAVIVAVLLIQQANPLPSTREAACGWSSEQVPRSAFGEFGYKNPMSWQQRHEH